ncbi:MAG: CBS domain-containing protein [Bacteroidetes bacterium]|nr:CBS domain-containing protein [Bacteroidota bacterium]MCH8942914.1 CBS domain-containing protein [Bacteroidota bacterium]
MTKTVSSMLKGKGFDIWSVSQNDSVFDALTLMAEKKCGALVVLEEEKLCGIISERDYARKIILLGKSSKETLVKEIMSSTVFYASPDLTAEECMAVMIDKRVRHLPVMENENLIGVISIGDVVKAVIDEKAFVIDQLERYITGRPNLDP